MPTPQCRPSTARRARAWVTGVLAAVACSVASFLAAADDLGPRVSLLSSGVRASIVIELDGDGAKATAIEATDNQSVAVEIGPVRGKVANQRLKAAANSPLVSEVRVRGVTQGMDGTIITIQVLAKAPVSGSVRRAHRRVYIDLERRDPRGLGTPPVAQMASNQPGPSAPAPAASTVAAPVAAKGASQAAGTPAQAAVSQPASSQPPQQPAPLPARPAAAARPSRAAAATRPDAGHSNGTPAAPSRLVGDAAAAAILPAPQPASGTLTPSLAPSTSTPGPRPAPAAPLPSPVPAPSGEAAARPAPSAVPAAAAAVARPDSPNGGADDLLKQAAALTKQSDVRGLERLKQTAVARLGASATEADARNDPTVAQLEKSLNEARQQRLLADAQLFRSQAAAGTLPTPAAESKPPVAATPPLAQAAAVPESAARPLPPLPATAAARPAVSPSSAAAPAQAPATAARPQADPVEAMLAQVMPDVERMRDTLSSWQPGYLASPSLPPQIDELNAKLRAMQPPAVLASPLVGLTSALTELSSTWVPGPDGKLIPFRDDVKAVERTRTALRTFIDAAAALQLTSGR
jgi:hypothetical protein